ncbi:adenylate kinase 7 [Pholidichthys leucotaenia]
MAEAETQNVKARVFISEVDLYASRHLAKLLCECVVGQPANSDTDGEVSTVSRPGVFQVVGTISDPVQEDKLSVLEHYFRLDREELLPKLMDCDVVVYNITQDAKQVEEALWAVSALHNQIGKFSGPKMFILVSTVMTWACSKPIDPDDLELPFTDEIFWSRKAHPNFKQHIDLEKKVVKLGKTNRKLFPTYVVASGLQYGMGEQLFHYFFKKSWLGKGHEVPVFGDGKNVIPTIHVSDLARVVQNVIEHKPKPYYLLAVDSSSNRMEEIVKNVASVLGTGKIQKKPFEEAFLVKDFSVTEIDYLSVNLRMKASYVNELFSMKWICESGLVENMELVVEEYRQARGLLPIRMCVLGPPAVGKSTMAKQICDHYKLHHVTLQGTITETIAQLDSKNVDPGVDFSAAEEQENRKEEEEEEWLSSLKDNMDQNGGILDMQLALKVLKDKLMSNPCRNQGYVLDDFPQTYPQAEMLFDAEEHDVGAQISSSSQKIIPEYVLVLNASDAFLIDRVINLPESVVQECNYELDSVMKRVAQYRENNMEEPVTNYFVEEDITTLHLEIISSEDPDCSLLMENIYNTVGKPRNYSPSSEEEEEERKRAEQRMRRQAQEREKEERWEQEEARSRAACWEEWTKSLEEAKQREEEELEAQSVPMRTYLLEHVMPTLTQGLMECCRVQPQDPVDFLAEFLVKNNSLFPQ